MAGEGAGPVWEGRNMVICNAFTFLPKPSMHVIKFDPEMKFIFLKIEFDFGFLHHVLNLLLIFLSIFQVYNTLY